MGGFNSQISYYQGQDLHLGNNGLNLLEVPKPHSLRESNDIGQYNAFG